MVHRDRPYHGGSGAGRAQSLSRSGLWHESENAARRHLSHWTRISRNDSYAAGQPVHIPWWYRKEFVLPASFKGKSVWLNFGGINYRANIWLNGKQIAKSDDVAGAWRTYEFNITDAALPGKRNVLAVQVFSPTETDLAITFVDWNPAPPDKNMGLWRDVEITTSGPVALRYPTVVSKVDSPANDKAHLTVTALLKNATNHPVKGTLKGRIENIEFSQEVELAAGRIERCDV